MRSFENIGVNSDEQWFFICVRANKGVEDMADIGRLLERGVDINARDHNGVSALVHALKSDPPVMKMLLEKGADPNARNEAGYTALTSATVMRNEWAMRMLVEHGADPDAPDKNGKTAWDHAADYPEGYAVLELARRRAAQERARLAAGEAEAARRRAVAETLRRLKKRAPRAGLARRPPS